MINRRWQKIFVAWLSMGLISVTLATAFITASPVLHQWVHSHFDSNTDSNQGEHGDELPSEDQRTGNCFACTIQFGVALMTVPFLEAFQKTSSVELSLPDLISFKSGTVTYLYPLSLAPPALS